MILEIAMSSYNHRRYSRPWGAILTFDGAKPIYDFAGRWTGDARGGSGEIAIDVQSGDVIAYGQKDNRKGYGSKTFAIVMPDGTLDEVTESVA